MTTQERSRRDLIRLLRHAYSGELGAALAYDGHARSVADPAEKREIGRIREQELDHRERVGRMLADLGSGPDARLERAMGAIGRAISLLCLIGGWFIPMYGAGRLEAGNIAEYEEAARLAADAGLHGLVDSLLDMAEVEWDHELYFRAQAARSVWWRLFPAWPAPLPRASIRLRAAARSGPRGLIAPGPNAGASEALRP